MRAAGPNFQVTKEFEGTVEVARSHGRDTAFAGHRMPVTFGQKFSTNTLAWVNGCFCIKWFH